MTQKSPQIRHFRFHKKDYFLPNGQKLHNGWIIAIGAFLTVVAVFVSMRLTAIAINAPAEGYRALTNATSTPALNGYSGLCKTVVNANGNDFFVPTKTSAEWNAFVANFQNNTSDTALINCSTSGVSVPYTTSANYTLQNSSDVEVVGGFGKLKDSRSNINAGAWTNSTSPTNFYQEPATFAYNGYVYIFGRNGDNDVEYAPINANGSLGAWTATASLNANRCAPAAFAYKGYAYVINGGTSCTWASRTNTTEYAPINADGTLGAWNYTSNTTDNMVDSVGFAYNGYAYNITSAGGSVIEYAPINANGTLGAWTASPNTLGSGHMTSSGFAYNGYAYALGGNGAGNGQYVEYAPINANGSVGTWTQTTSLTNTRYQTRAGFAHNGYAYMLGGANTNTTERAPINANGSIGAWTLMTNLNVTRTNFTAGFVYNDYVYALGGATSGTTSTEYAPLVPFWTQATANAAWSDRFFYDTTPTITYDNKLWILGGMIAGWDTLNDVWYSSDGATWTQATANAAWVKRAQAVKLVYDNKMWIMGGCSGAGSCTEKNDVWWSTDGVTWTQATANAAWGARRNHFGVVHDNKMWIMGGHGYLNDVWWSTDGANWTQATNFPTGIMAAVLLSFNNKMWVIDGEYINAASDDVWSSSDGGAWTLETADDGMGASKTYAPGVVFDNKMWMLGGITSGHEQDVCSSSNGTSWTCVSANWSGRWTHTAAVFNNKIWVMGGGAGMVGNNDVWYYAPAYSTSNDYSISTNNSDQVASSWTQLVAQGSGTSFAQGYCHRFYTWNSALWNIGCSSGGAVYSSADGVNWTSRGNFPGTSMSITTTIHDNKLWKMGGYIPAGNDSGTVYSSSDGENWTLVTSSAGWHTGIDRFGGGSVSYGGKLWYMGGADSWNNRYNDVWWSTDGASWTQATASAGWSARSSMGGNGDVIVFDNKMWVIGGGVGGGVCPNDAWWSTDGANWTQATSNIPLAGGGRGGFGLVVYDNKIWLIGGSQCGNGVQHDDIWWSADGATWTEASGIGWVPRASFGAAVFNGSIYLGGGDTYLGADRVRNDVWYYVPTYSTYSIVTNNSDQVATGDWTWIKGVNVTETKPANTHLHYATSFDARTTWKIWDSTASAWRSIARNNGGTWEYNSAASGSTTWTSCTTNDQEDCLSQAFGIFANQMIGIQLAGISSANWSASNGWSVGATINVAAGLTTNDSAYTPSVDNITFNANNPDSSPAPSNLSNQTQNTQVTSSSFTPSGYLGSLKVIVIGEGSPQVNINGGGWVKSGTITSGQSIQTRATTAGSAATTRTIKLIIGDIVYYWTITTQ